MPSIYFGAEHDMFRETVRRYVETEITPNVSRWEAEKALPREFWHGLGDMGFLGLAIPERLGGAGADIFSMLVFLEEIARSRSGGVMGAVLVQAFIAPAAIAHYGSPELQERYVRPSATGRAVGAIAISEPDAGSDVAGLRTSARLVDGTYVLDGAKTWITNGVVGDFVVVAARTEPESKGSKGVSLLVVERGQEGFTAQRLHKIGWHCSDTGELAFSGVRVPESRRVGAAGEGFKMVMRTFAFERLVTAGSNLGAAQVALEETLAYMRERKAFGQSIDRFQALRHRLADLFAELEAVRQLIYHAAWLYDSGADPSDACAKAKLLATELHKRVVDECLQFHGGFGYTDEYVISRLYRDARVNTIVAGTSEIMREIIAKAAIDGVSYAPRAAAHA